MSALDDLMALGGPVDDAALTARFIAGLSMGDQQKARLLRDYLRETKVPLSRAILVEARDYSFYLGLRCFLAGCKRGPGVVVIAGGVFPAPAYDLEGVGGFEPGAGGRAR